MNNKNLLNSNPMVTWILPVKNGMPYLSRCLESIHKQTYNNHQIIAWVNQSEDGSLEELNRWIPSKIDGIIINNQPFDNLGECLASMVKYADTEFLARIDCDDYNEENRLEEQIRIILQSKNIAAVGSWMNIISENDEFISIGKKPTNNFNLLKWDLLFRCPLYHPTMVLRKSLILKSNNYNNLQTAQDYDLWLRLIQKGQIKTIEKPLLNYRKTDGSVTKTYEHQRSEINFNIYKKYALQFFDNIDEDILLKLWNSISPHSKNETKISLKLYLRCLMSFCLKNNIDFLKMINNKEIKKEILKNKKINRSNFLLIIYLTYIFNTDYLIRKYL